MPLHGLRETGGDVGGGYSQRHDQEEPHHEGETRGEERGKRIMTRTLVFLCPHNAAKSVLAAAYCQHLAAQCGLQVQVTSAGTEPDAAASPDVVTLLRGEGLDVTHHRPRHVTREELGAAFRIISLGCDVSDLAPPGTRVEHWDDVPAPSQHLAQARNVIYAHVECLIAELTRGAGPGAA